MASDGQNVVEFSSLSCDIKDLLKEALKARERSYSPYSKFPVGAALVCADGTVYRGCNVENSSTGLAICAERTAVTKAVSEGKMKYTAIAVIANNNSFVSPCGACRQFISEFGIDIDVYLANSDLKKVYKTTVAKLLPLNFRLELN